MEDRDKRIDELIDSLRKCFDGDGEFAAHPSDENKAAQAYTTAVGGLGFKSEHFIDLLIGQAKTMYTDKRVISKAEQSIRDFVNRQLAE